ncbi:ABC transporter permease [Bradyrhizobium sp. 2TAF24]|uniref:ABC transporter permease n=1 Tax=Bradyrhizobium sp. 2TAF24 TaxID=3233011 RepID=UPI003F9173F6
MPARTILQGLALPLGALLLAEIAMRASGIHSDGLALPSDVGVAAITGLRDGTVLLNTGDTLVPAFGGALLGGGLGLLVGLWLGLSTLADDLSALTVELLRPIPPVALIPLALLVFGFGFTMEALIVAFTCFWPMLLLTRAATRAIDRELLDVADVLGLTAAARIWKIVLPASLPRVFVAARLTLGIALIVAVTTEIAANPSGIGYALVSAQQELRPDIMYVYVAWLALLGWALNSGLVLLERQLFVVGRAEVAR